MEEKPSGVVHDAGEQQSPYDKYPLFLTPKMVKEILQLSYGVIYNLFEQDDFPSFKVGKRYVVPKNKFLEWVEQSAKKPK